MLITNSNNYSAWKYCLNAHVDLINEKHFYQIIFSFVVRFSKTFANLVLNKSASIFDQQSFVD